MSRVRRFRPAAALLTLWLLVAPQAANAAGEAAPDSTKPSPAASATVAANPPVPHLFTRGDLVFLGIGTAATTLAVFNDRWLTNKAIQVSSNTAQKNVADFFQPLGNPTYVIPAAAALYGGSVLMKHPQVARRSARVAISVSVASAIGTGLKEVLGRERPYESPEQSNTFKPFSGHTSFPSGHAITAFAAAVALDRETTGHWVPFIVYPAATAVAWSRVHDLRHWTSDVVAGAALGGWTAWKTETFLDRRALGVAPTHKEKQKARTSWLLVPNQGTVQLVVVHTLP